MCDEIRQPQAEYKHSARVESTKSFIFNMGPQSFLEFGGKRNTSSFTKRLDHRTNDNCEDYYMES